MSGPRDAIREAYRINLIADGEDWMHMIISRNLNPHSYNEDTADVIAGSVTDIYYLLFKALELNLESLRSGNQPDILDDNVRISSK